MTSFAMLSRSLTFLQALIEQLEDEIDLEAYRSRRDEETFSLEEILAGLNKKK